MDGKTIRTKLIGSDDERAVSPVIGVILMVAITVILAAVIAAFVLDLGESVDDDPRAAADISDGNESEVEVSVTSLDNADGIAIVDDDGDILDDSDAILNSTGESVTVGATGSAGDAEVEGDGSHTVQAYFGSDLDEDENIDDETDSSAVIGSFEASDS